MNKTNFETEKELLRKQRNAAIRQDFAAIKKSYPDVKAHRIHVELAKSYGMTAANIRLICANR